MDNQSSIDSFLEGKTFAVAGASNDRQKYGNMVFRCYLQNNLTVYPINPNVSEVEGHPTITSLADLPEAVHGVSIITPPKITEQVVADAIDAGIKHLWMQPGAESDAAIREARAAGINVMANGPCLLVVLGFRNV